ncbi:Elongin A binding-protein 1 [Trinorchestia longiramus]|nr:Elongin A binding-protein 1 [Trinorchestia longiramus]
MDRYAKLINERATLKRELEDHKQLIDAQHKKLKLESSGSGGSSASSQPSSSSAGAAFPLGSRKPRIGAVTNVSALLNASAALKQRAPSSTPVSSGRQTFSTAAGSSTIASAGAKGFKRVAHVPKVEVLARPVIASEFGGKVPQNIRQRYLNSFIDEALKFAECPSDAFKIALSEEKVCYKRASSRAVYLSLAVNTTKRLRAGTVSDQAKELIDGVDLPAVVPGPASQPSHPVNPNHRVQSHFTTLSGGGQKGSWSIEKPAKTDVQAQFNSLKGAKLYQFVQKYLITPEQLMENGYPHVHPDVKGKAICKIDSRMKISPSPTERYCSRCSALYLVDKWGFPKTIVNCAYHWGRANKRRVATGLETRYGCCQGDLQSEGCCLASTHVSDNINPDNFTGFVRTLPREPATPGDHGIYALDCEMCYTTAGNELTRVTVIDHNNTVVYETFVQPENQILDYNTRFSGISEEQLEDVTTTLRDVQAALLTRFSSNTILVGHSLESDFRALKLIHHCVIDTSVMFPHKMGPPYKRALRNLASDYLKKIIQNDVSGHDSAEDAITCMELLHWKIKEDLKTSPL